MELSSVTYHYSTPEEMEKHKLEMFKKGFLLFDEDKEFLWVEYDCHETLDLSKGAE